jgi:hypothetical protein
MPSYTNQALGNTTSTSAGYSGGGNNDGYSVSIGVPVYSSGNATFSAGGGVSGEWGSNPSSYSVGAGLSYKLM